jgi:hypothetical protein
MLAPVVCAAAVGAIPLFHYTEGRTFIAQALAALGTGVAALTLLKRIPRIYPSVLAFGALTAFWGLSVIEDTEALESYLTMVKMTIFCLATHVVFRTPKRLLLLFGIYAGTALIALGLNWSELQHLRVSVSGSDLPDKYRFAGTFGNANAAGIYGTMVLLSGLIVFFNTRHWARWPVLLSGAAGGLATCYYCGSRKMVLGLALIALAVPWLAMQRD